MIKKYHYSSLFERKLYLFPKEQRQIIIEEINLFTQNSFEKSFNTHPLKEKYQGYYAFSIDKNLRIMFRPKNPDFTEILFYDIGGHEIYK